MLKKMKKFMGIMLVMMISTMMLSFHVTAEEPEEHTIAVAVATYSADFITMQDYYENYLGEHLNINFIFSEELGMDVANIMNFVENAYSSGAEAIIDYACTTREDLQPIAARCDELGMYLVTWMDQDDSLGGFEYGVGSTGIDYADSGEVYKNVIEEVIGDGENHSMVLCTMAARYGNVDNMTSSTGCMEAFQEIYGLEFEDEIANLIMADSVTEIATGNENVKITIFPSYSGDDLKEVLKGGDYDTVVSVGPIYLRFESAISEMEKALDKNIKLISYTSISDSTTNSFHTLDEKGNPSLDAAILSNQSRLITNAVLAINAVNGDADAVKMDGGAGYYQSYVWPCTSPEDYDFLSVLEQDESTYVYTIDEVKQMIKFYNEDVTPEVIQEWLEKAQLESTLERRGLSR